MEGYVKSINGRLRRQENAKQGNLWDWLKSKMGDMYIFYIGGYNMVNVTG